MVRIKIKVKEKPKTKAPFNKRTKNALREAENTLKGKGKMSASSAPLTEITKHGDDLYIIPVKGEIHPARIKEAHQAENIVHHQTDVALHQENQKVKEAMAARKSAKRIYRNPGPR